MSEFKRVLPDGSEVTDLALVDVKGRVQTANITTKFREAFESYTPNGSRWAESKASGDIVTVDGNAVGASYLVISKDPLSAGTETTVLTQDTYDMPVEMSIGLHMSQRTLGQEVSVEVISNEDALPAVADIAIANLSQATTVLTVNTVAPHGLKPGVRIGTFGNPDSRANYPALVVASIPTPTQFTATAGPGGTIPSLTIATSNGGFVYVRSATGYARNAVSMIFENAVLTNASFYAKSESGDVLPCGGTMTGSHAVTTASTASIQAVNASYTYAFAPTTEFRLTLMADRFQWSDAAVDAITVASNRATRTQIVPDPTKKYKLRIRATNNKGLTIPVAQIVSIVKTGTTTATVTTDVPHGLTVTDQINLYGARDQTNFPNLTTATAVASVLTATTFTVVIGTASSTASNGGYVARVQGGNLMSVVGAVAPAVQTATIVAGVLTVVGTATWGFLPGDYLNLVGVRDTGGVSVGIDGAYRVRMVSTTTMELEPIGTTSIPANLGATNCGGGAIKRTDVRISFARLFDFGRQRIEMLPRPSGDEAAAAPVRVQGGSVTVSGSAVTTPVTVTTLMTNAGASTNATSVKTTAGTVYGVVVSNQSVSDRFVKLYNKATAPVVGTDVPVLTLKIAAGDTREFNFGATGVRFATGIAFAITGLATDADTTAIAAAEVKLLTSYV